LLKRSERERTGLALIEGLRLVTEALRYPQLVRHIIVAPELLRSQHGQALLQDQRQKGLPCLYVSAEIFQSFSLKDIYWTPRTRPKKEALQDTIKA